MAPIKQLLTIVLLLVLLAPPAQAFDLNIDFNKLRDVVKSFKPMSEQEETELGKGIAANLLGAAPLVPDAALQTYVNRIGKWLAMHSERPGLPWHFGVLDTDSVNAFAAPGATSSSRVGCCYKCATSPNWPAYWRMKSVMMIERHALETTRKGTLAEFAGDTLGQALRNEGSAEFTRIISAGTEVYARGLDKKTSSPPTAWE